LHSVSFALQLEFTILMVMFFWVIADTLECLPSVSRKRSREYMDVIKARFERLIEHVGIMVLKLLCPLNRDHVVKASG
jgi:hypothetical protein